MALWFRGPYRPSTKETCEATASSTQVATLLTLVSRGNTRISYVERLSPGISCFSFGFGFRDALRNQTRMQREISCPKGSWSSTAKLSALGSRSFLSLHADELARGQHEYNIYTPLLGQYSLSVTPEARTCNCHLTFHLLFHSMLHCWGRIPYMSYCKGHDDEGTGRGMESSGPYLAPDIGAIV